jgi:tetratricopeptide (TPR) repeat protein
LVIDDMRAIARRRDIPSVIAVHAAVLVVWHDSASGLPSCGQTVIEMREHAKATGLRHPMSTGLVCWGAFAALSDGDLETARAWIQELGEEVKDWGPLWALAYHGLRVLEALAQGDLREASEHERELAQLGYTSGMPYEEAQARVTAAYVCHRCGTHDQARAHLERALEIARSIPSPYVEWFARLAEAHVLLERGRDADGLEALRVAMALGRAGGYVNSTVWLPAVMARLCARALEAGIEVDYVRDLVKRRRLSCEPPPVAVESWPWPVKVFTLGRFEVRNDDRPLRFAGKVQRKPLALLKAMAVLGRPGLREERAMDLLWPDSEGDAARRALTSAVFRLRRLLGHERAVVRSDGEISLDPACCWVDLWAVERLLDQAESAAGAGRESGAASVTPWTETAAALYRGPLFGGAEDEPWSIGAADGLRARLLRQLLLLSRRCEAAGDSQKAAELLETALRVDPRAVRSDRASDR